MNMNGKGAPPADGSNGCSKGAYCVNVDPNHKSSSENFKALQYVANKKGDIAILEGMGSSVQVSSLSFRGIPFKKEFGYEPTMDKDTGFMGLTLNPVRGPIDPFALYSPDKDTHIVFATGMSMEDMVSTIHHEIRHVFLGDFGRLKRGEHPASDSQNKAAEDEAIKNMKEK